MARKVVKLLRKSGMYAEGEVAGFPENIANQMIERGIAVAHQPETKQTGKRRPRPDPESPEQDTQAEDKQMRSRGGANYETK